MSPRPADGTKPGTLHWLYRPTGEPHWMVATWTGEAWKTLEGQRTPEYLVWWNYSAPAAPPRSREADQRKAAFAECRALVQGMVDDFVHENFSYDGSTGVWEGTSSQEDHAEVLNDVLEAIDARVVVEFGAAESAR